MAIDKLDLVIQKMVDLETKVENVRTGTEDLRVFVLTGNETTARIEAHQGEMLKKVESLHVVTFDPKEGLVLKVHDLEGHVKNSKRIYWTFFTTILTIGAALIVATLT